MTLHIHTPLVESRSFNLPSGHPVWLKLDALQPPGSFKIRGVGHACETYRARGARRFVSSSSGNAGLAVAYAGRKLGVPVTVVVPETATERAKALLKGEGAEVVVHGATWQEANEKAQSLVGPTDALVHPFDDPLLWEGHASMIDEVREAGAVPDAVVLSVGGGGLLCGVAEGLRRNGWNDVPIFAVETEGMASYRTAIEAGRPVELSELTGIATSLGARRISERAYQWSKERPIRSLVVSDRSALLACERFLDDHRILVEPACGASLAVAYEHGAELDAFERVLVIVCGGATATIDQIRRWLAK
ncbi:MAG TPA: pyridoxal-phosphate dependent enzyme [Burkholderiales bacterium]|nr:pyridoxal-phosphate dependent enzyme [Burkholderiales bacterium]